MHPVPTVGIVCLRGNEVLLLEPGPTSRQPLHLFGLPAGHVEAGETRCEAAVRELHEETGLLLNASRFRQLPTVYVAEIERRDGSHVLMDWVVFLVEITDEKASETGEGIPHWVAVTELSGYRLINNVAEAVAEAVRFRQI
jgi:ADP-ribose pyrophosphatase YjhB (NUDIX family)